MTIRSIGIEEARPILGDLVTAAQHGHPTTLTRHGKAAARIVAIQEPTMDTQGMIDQVTALLGEAADDFDTAAIVREIGDTFGRDIETVEDVPFAAFWPLVRKHERQRDQAVIWSVVEGNSPGSHAVDPGPAGVDIPEDVMEWATGYGLAVDNPDVYLLVTPADEAGDVAGEIAYRKGVLPGADVTAIREALAEEQAERNA